MEKLNANWFVVTIVSGNSVHQAKHIGPLIEN